MELKIEEYILQTYVSDIPTIKQIQGGFKTYQCNLCGKNFIF